MDQQQPQVAPPAQPQPVMQSTQAPPQTPITPPVSSFSAPPLGSPPMQPKRRSSTVLLFILFILIVISAGVFIAVTQKGLFSPSQGLPQVPPQTQIPVAQPTIAVPTPTSAPTAEEEIQTLDTGDVETDLQGVESELQNL